jgi:23S rRNA (adenine1618-N6)-methyltransferase
VFVSEKTKEPTVDWADLKVVYTFNKALLKLHFNIQDWEMPQGYLVPPIPSRTDYVYHIADLINEPTTLSVKGLDIGCGANCIYPLIATSIFPHWSMVGTDIDPVSLEYAKRNTKSKTNIEIRQQTNTQQIFQGIIGSNETFAFTMSNPPFSESIAEANANSMRKLRNLSTTRRVPLERNFQGRLAMMLLF